MIKTNLLLTGFLLWVSTLQRVAPSQSAESAGSSSVRSYGNHVFERHANMGDQRGCSNLQWTVDKASMDLTLAVSSVPSSDWIAVGFSENGGMKGADMLMVRRFSNGKYVVDDLISKDYALPERDVLQNGELLFSETDELDQIRVVLRRRLNTCDKDDIPIKSYKQSLICASGKLDANGQALFHGPQHNRIDVNMMVDEQLLTERQLNLHQNLTATPLVTDIVTAQGDLTKALEPFPVDFQMPAHTLDPSIRTSYTCVLFRMPENFNAIAVETVWDNGTTMEDSPVPSYIHHQWLAHCAEEDALDPAWFDGQPFDCLQRRLPCSNVIGNAKMGRTQAPAAIHIPLKKGQLYAIEVHYDNPYSLPIEDDTSGLRIWTEPVQISSSQPGQITFFRGQFDKLVIPADPEQRPVELSFQISSAATAAILPPQGVQVWATGSHMHEAGIRSQAKHIRNGVHIANVMDSKGYDFALQTPKWELWKLLPGDTIIMTCFFRPEKDRDIVGGFETSDEMCDFNFAFSPALESFEFAMGVIVEPGQPFNSTYVTPYNGLQFDFGVEGFDPTVYPPDNDGFVPLREHEFDFCELVLQDEIQLHDVSFANPQIPAQLYLAAFFIFLSVLPRAWKKIGEMQDERIKRNTISYLVNFIWTVIAFPVLLVALIDLYQPARDFDAVDPEHYTAARGMIVFRSVIYLTELCYRINPRWELIFHHILTSGVVMLSNWLAMESLAFHSILKVGIMLCLNPAMEQAFHLALFLKNLGYGHTKWWSWLCYAGGVLSVITSTILAVLSYVAMVHAYKGKDASWAIPSHSVSDWKESTVSLELWMGLLSVSIAFLLFIQYWNGRIMILLSRRRHREEKQEYDELDVEVPKDDGITAVSDQVSN